MTKVFTQNDLLRFIYGETSKEESQIIQALILTDDEFYEAFTQLSDTKLEVDKIDKIPSKKAIDNILKYSRSINLHSV